jgi:lysophospholipase L1-like esterase
MRTAGKLSLVGGLAALLLAAATVLPGSPLPTATAAPAAPCTGDGWVAGWAASPTDSVTPLDASGGIVPQILANQTLRMVVTPHLGGSQLRIRLSNRFGEGPTTFGRVTVGVQTRGAAVASTRPVTFGQAASVTVPAGQDVVSDPVSLTFDAFTPLAVSIFLPGTQKSPTKHWNANATSYYSLPLTGDLTGRQSGVFFPAKTLSWLYVNGVDVQAPNTRSIVAFGDSITDGFVGSTPLSIPADASVADRNGRYPDVLQRRLQAAGIPLSVVNAGIGSNRLLTDGFLMMGPSGLNRFDADALGQAGVSGVLLQEGINDLGIPPNATAAQLIDGYTQVINRSHAAGLKVWVGTLLPASNALVDGVIIAPRSDIDRQAINTWIRGQNLADGVVDFDAALRDPANPSILNPAYASTDNLHPNLAGYQRMAEVVDLGLLSTAACTP